MKISSQTLAIIKNFSTINTGIVINPGNVISTKSENGSIAAFATVSEKFPKTIAIYELSRFINVISALEDPDFEFHDNYVVVSGGKNKVKCIYADPSVIVSPKQSKAGFGDELLTFSLTKEDVISVFKASTNIPGNNLALVIESIDGMVVLSLKDTANPSSMVFSIETEIESDITNKIHVRLDNLKIMMLAYDVTYTSKGLVIFNHKDILKYYVPTESVK